MQIQRWLIAGLLIVHTGCSDNREVSNDNPNASVAVATAAAAPAAVYSDEDIAKANEIMDQAQKTFTNSVGMEFKLIPAGTFMMGTPMSAEWKFHRQGYLHKVVISRPFYIGTTEVTRQQWKEIMGTTPWKEGSKVKENGPYAADHISWDDASEFIRKLSAKEHRIYRLPTEAEWEYCCRAGSTSRYCFGDSHEKLVDYAWYSNSKSYIPGPKHVQIVAQKKPNVWGLYDMHGNVAEWCNDRYSRDYYKESPAIDPQGPSSGQYRVRRGGMWYRVEVRCRAAWRSLGNPAWRISGVGLRIVLVPCPLQQLSKEGSEGN